MESINGILEGIVVSNHDETKSGILLVSIPEVSNEAVNVTFTSPFYALNGGGMLAIPEVGSKILVLSKNKKYYYLSTIVEQPSNEQIGGLIDFRVINDKYLYTERGRPQKVTYANQFNAGLKISRRLLPDYMSAKVDLDSEGGKRISLSDSPLSDVVLIRNEHGDGIVISSEANDVHSERSIEVKSKGAQRYVVFQSGMDIYVIDGRDINIENTSTGAYANDNAVGRYGNINLRSENKDISVLSKSDNGRVFIVTPSARIQIESDGSIVLDSAQNIQIKSTNDIDIKSNKAIRISGETIDIKATNNLRLQAGLDASILAGGTNSLDGDQIHFNSGLSQPANDTSITTPERNDYGE
jgi:hypothetical protein